MRKKYYVIFGLLLVEVCTIFLGYKSYSNKTLDKIKEDANVNKKQFAMYIRDTDTENYREYNSEDYTFPNGYKLNVDRSECQDYNGVSVSTDGVINQTDDGKVMVTSTKTVYCIFYFDKKEPQTLKYFKEKVGAGGLKETNKGDLKYRYVGTQDQSSSINNYVCFGANSCAKDETNAHMYRIIGITGEGQLKIQKNSSISTSQWARDFDIKWPNSQIYTYLKKIYEIETYVTEAMKNKIDITHTWNTGDVTDYNSTAADSSYGTKIYEQEKTTTSHKGEIGLAYLSDYYFAYNDGGTQSCNSSGSCYSWMIPRNYKLLWENTSGEWTMSRYGDHGGGDYFAWNILANGTVINNSFILSYAVRPVFYLQSTTTITGGEGTLESPYIIN